MDRKELEEKIVRKASVDAEFRQSLVKDPKGTIEKVLKAKIPPDMEIHILEETPSRFYLVLPFNADELSDEELQKATGGAIGVVEEFKKPGKKA